MKLVPSSVADVGHRLVMLAAAQIRSSTVLLLRGHMINTPAECSSFAISQA